jgi:hypothetical protein
MDEWVSVQDIAPNLLATVGTQCVNKRTVQKALVQHRWFEDVKNNLPAREASEFMALLNLVGSIGRI